MDHTPCLPAAGLTPQLGRPRRPRRLPQPATPAGYPSSVTTWGPGHLLRHNVGSVPWPAGAGYPSSVTTWGPGHLLRHNVGSVAWPAGAGYPSSATTWGPGPGRPGPATPAPSQRGVRGTCSATTWGPGLAGRGRLPQLRHSVGSGAPVPSQRWRLVRLVRSSSVTTLALGSGRGGGAGVLEGYCCWGGR